MKIKRFDNKNVSKVLEECRTALEPIAEKYGLVLDDKGRSYRREALPVMFQFLVEERDESGKVLTAVAKDFVNTAPLHGLRPEDLGRQFETGKGRYEICGMKPRARKYPVLARKLGDGKTYKFGAEYVRAMLEVSS